MVPLVQILLSTQASRVDQEVLFLPEIQVDRVFLLFLSFLVVRVAQVVLLYQILLVGQNLLEHLVDQEHHSHQQSLFRPMVQVDQQHPVDLGVLEDQ